MRKRELRLEENGAEGKKCWMYRIGRRPSGEAGRPCDVIDNQKVRGRSVEIRQSPPLTVQQFFRLIISPSTCARQDSIPCLIFPQQNGRRDLNRKVQLINKLTFLLQRPP